MIGHNTRPRALVSSAKKVKLTPTNRSVGENWQEPLWVIYENLGAVHYGMNFKRNAAQRVNYFAAEVGEDYDEPVPSENAQAMEAVDRLGDVGELVGGMVVQKNVAGEGYLYGTEIDDGESFETLSTLEVNERLKPSRADDGPKRITDEDFLARLWYPSPRKHDLADSPLRSVQAQCEQLLLLNDQISATAQSRLSAGLLLIPDGLSFAVDPEETQADDFQTELIEMMTTAIRDTASAARVAPATVTGDAEQLKEMRLIDFSRDMDSTFAGMREELIRQIANGIDLPAEILTGLADLNHWSLWGIDESTAKHHIDPDVLGVLAGMTKVYLRPLLEEGGMSPDQARQFVIWRDYSDLTSRPLSPDQAERLFDKSVITADQLKRIVNIGPEDEEVGPGDIAARAEAVGIMFRAGFEPEAILAALGLPSIEHTGVAPVTVQSEKEVDDDIPAGPDNVDRGPPVTAAAGIRLTRLGDIDGRLVTQIVEASESAAHRALERAGAKVRAKAKKDRQISAAIDGIDNAEVTRHLGSARIEQLQVSADQLVPRDTFDPLVKRLVALLVAAQVEVDEELETLTDTKPAPVEVGAREDAIDLFVAALLAAVVARLFTSDPDPDPADTGEISDDITTGQMVFEFLSRAGGAPVAEFTPETPRGFALGERTRAILRDAGYVTETETWVYGTAPRRTFEPHRALDGRVVRDKESLTSTTTWLGSPFYYPGDHKGCLCRYVPTVLPTALE